MRMKKSPRRLTSVLVMFLLSLCVVICCALAEMRMPEASGTDVKKNGDLTVDCSHMDDGYIMVKGKSSQKRLKPEIKVRPRDHACFAHYVKLRRCSLKFINS